MTSPELRKETGIRWVRVLIISVIWIVTGSLSLPLMAYVLPDLEAAWWPPLTDQEASEAHLNPDDDGFLLWKWEFHKSRRAFPVFVAFMAFDPEHPNERVPVEVFVNWKCTDNFRTDRTAMRGTDNDKYMCARLPPFWRGRGDIVIDGYGDYRVGHPFYTVPVRFPRVNDYAAKAP